MTARAPGDLALSGGEAMTMTSHVPVPPGSPDYCGAFDRCDLCRAPIGFRDGAWVTLAGGRAGCPGRYVREVA